MWYAVQVTTGQEGLTIEICRHLIEERFLGEAFYPQKELMKKSHGRWETQRSPLFPGYVFVATEAVEALYGALKSVPKRTRIIRTGPELVPVQEEEIRWLTSITNRDWVAEMSRGRLEGSKLVVEQGALRGQEAGIQKIDRHKRTAILGTEMFGRRVEIILGLEVTVKI